MATSDYELTFQIPLASHVVSTDGKHTDGSWICVGDSGRSASQIVTPSDADANGSASDVSLNGRGADLTRQRNRVGACRNAQRGGWIGCRTPDRLGYIRGKGPGCARRLHGRDHTVGELGISGGEAAIVLQ